MTIRRNYLFLLVGLFSLILTAPLWGLIVGEVAPLVSHVSYASLLMFGVWTLINDRRWFILGLLLVLVDLAATTYSYFEFTTAATVVAQTVTLTFCLITLCVAGRDVLLSRTTDLNRILGSACIYLLLGVTWSILYVILEGLSPGSFNGLDSVSVMEIGQPLVYFSFVTLTTLGYGDITPATDIARTLAYLQAVFGQLYVAILVAGLVGTWVAKNYPE